MISKDKTYRTRDGREVRIYATDGYEYPIHGAVMDRGWCVHYWDAEGRGHLQRFDLIEVKPRHKRTVWVNVFPEHDQPLPTVMGYESKMDADGMADKSRIACIKVDLDFEEGEGLTEIVCYVGSGGGTGHVKHGGGFMPSVNKVIKEGL